MMMENVDLSFQALIKSPNLFQLFCITSFKRVSSFKSSALQVTTAEDHR